MSGFPFFTLRGAPNDLGALAAKYFGDRISGAVRFYEGLFAQIAKKSIDDPIHIRRIQDEADRYSRAVGSYFPELALEINAIAAALGIAPWRLHALNARTEIYRTLANETGKRTEKECTSIFFPQSCILGQTWDWHPELEKLCVVLRIEKPSKPKVLMFTEPGIIGKIGINSAGLGLCLTILFADAPMGGVPIHVLLRAILECESADAAAELIEKTECSTTSSLLIADKNGKAHNYELLGASKTRVSLPTGELVHTNHYLSDEASASAVVPGSVYRLKKAAALFGQRSSEGERGMKRILSDKSDPDFPICRQYAPGLDFLVGTVAAMVLDLQKTEMHLAKGPSLGADSSWTKYDLQG